MKHRLQSDYRIFTKRHMKTRTRDVWSSLLILLTSCVIRVSASSSSFTHLSSSSSSTSQLPSGPKFLEKFPDQTLDPGPSVSLKCIASGVPLPQVTWLVNGLPVPESSRFRTGDYVTRDLLVVSYVNISSVMTQDGGIYQCSASTGLSTIRHSGRLNVYGPPIIRSIENATAVAGETFTIMCPVSGYPIDHIYWEKGKKHIQRADT